MKNNAIDFEALMQRIATTVEIINHGLERLDEGARENLKTQAVVFCMELGKFREYVLSPSLLDAHSEELTSFCVQPSHRNRRFTAESWAAAGLEEVDVQS